MAISQGKFVAYLRVSTDRQGKSGLGLDAQRDSVRRFVADRAGTIIAPEYVEVESGKHNDRPQLAKALKRCRLTGAILVVAKLDRLSRNAAFLLTLRDSGVEFVAADLPEANTMTVGVMAVVAQHEREAISARTKAALAAAKAHGTRLGGPRAGSADIRQFQATAVAANQAKAGARAEELREIMEAMQAECLTLQAMANRLNEQGVLTSRRVAGAWTPMGVRRVRARLAR